MVDGWISLCILAFWDLYSCSDEVKGEQAVKFFSFFRVFFCLLFSLYATYPIIVFIFYFWENAMTTMYLIILSASFAFWWSNFGWRFWSAGLVLMVLFCFWFCFTEFELELELEINLMFLLSVDWYNLSLSCNGMKVLVDTSNNQGAMELWIFFSPRALDSVLKVVGLACEYKWRRKMIVSFPSYKS